MHKALVFCLSITMLVSSSGVTVARMLCGGKPVQKTMTCPKCNRARPGAAFSAKSCCSVTSTYFAVKAEYGKPLEHIVTLDQTGNSGAAPVLLPASGPVRTHTHCSNAPPDTSPEKCALNSIFRI